MISSRELDLVLTNGAGQGGIGPAPAGKRITYAGKQAVVRF